MREHCKSMATNSWKLYYKLSLIKRLYPPLFKSVCSKVNYMTKFSELGIKEDVLKALSDIGFNDAFPIQEAAIPHLVNGEDVIGQAQTGTGKTAAFALPILNKVNASERIIQALILVPTRELAVQVADEIKKFSTHSGHKILAIYGGQSFNAQNDALRWGKDIIVATPGRLIDFMKRNLIDLSKVKFVVLDEADRMLDMGFIDDVKFIMDRISPSRQVALFSATMPDEIMRLTSKYMNKPVKIAVNKGELSGDNIAQAYLIVDEKSKFHHLIEILKGLEGRTIIFCGTKSRTRKISHDLYLAGLRTAEIHGDLSQNQRDRSIQKFKSGRIDVLVATDVAARGLDIPQVEHVINYDVPNEPMAYFHRIGRTARAGASGSAITLVPDDRHEDFQAILRHTKAKVERLNEKMGVQFEIKKAVKAPAHHKKFWRRGPSQHSHRPSGHSGHKDGHHKHFRGRPSRGRRFFKK